MTKKNSAVKPGTSMMRARLVHLLAALAEEDSNEDRISTAAGELGHLVLGGEIKPHFQSPRQINIKTAEGRRLALIIVNMD